MCCDATICDQSYQSGKEIKEETRLTDTRASVTLVSTAGRRE